MRSLEDLEITEGPRLLTGALPSWQEVRQGCPQHAAPWNNRSRLNIRGGLRTDPPYLHGVGQRTLTSSPTIIVKYPA